MMRVMLIEHPRSINPERCNDIANTPLSSCLLTGYIAGMLTAGGCEVEIVEGHLDGLTYEEIGERVRLFKPDIVGIHMIYQWGNDSSLLSFIEGIKAGGTAPYITVYGFYPTFSFENILRISPSIDSIVLGEPEITFHELTRTVSGKTGHRNIPGIAWIDGSGSLNHSVRPLAEDLDTLPFPVRTDAMLRISEVNIQGSRGCYGRCTFCYINPFYGNGSRWRYRSPENIISEIDEIISGHGKREFYFMDPNFFGMGERGQERAKRLASLLKGRDIRFGIEGRVNDIHDSTIEALVNAGLRQILIGLESGQDSSLKRMNKMTTVKQNEKALRILRRHGIEPNIGFIMFEPDSSLIDIRENLEFLKRNDLLKNLPVTANLLYHHQIVLRGTPAYSELKKSLEIVFDDHTFYEGIPSYRDPSVNIIAAIIRQVTNFLFTEMSGIWSGRVSRTNGLKERCERVNTILVELFENILVTLESGDVPTKDEIDLIIKGAEERIRGVLNGTL